VHEPVLRAEMIKLFVGAYERRCCCRQQRARSAAFAASSRTIVVTSCSESLDGSWIQGAAAFAPSIGRIT
jgi:hypothetical protein